MMYGVNESAEMDRGQWSQEDSDMTWEGDESYGDGTDDGSHEWSSDGMDSYDWSADDLTTDSWDAGANWFQDVSNQGNWDDG